jgi:hypothetical protein
MSLVINHNLMAMNAARNLGNSYNNLSWHACLQACASIPRLMMPLAWPSGK